MLTGEPSPKKPRTHGPGGGVDGPGSSVEGQVNLLNISEAAGEPLQQVKLPLKTAKKPPVLAQHPGGTVFLKNAEKDAVTMPCATIILGFGKTTYRQIKDNAEPFDSSCNFEFRLTKSTDFIIIGSSLTTVGAAVNEKSEEKSADDAKVCYHTMNDEPGNTSVAFTLTQDVQVVCRSKPLKDQGTSATAASFGAFVNVDVKKNEPAIQLVWVCKWGASGLLPVRPVVVTTCTVTLPGEKCIAMT